jgi:hypothetical protein
MQNKVLTTRIAVKLAVSGNDDALANFKRNGERLGLMRYTLS